MNLELLALLDKFQIALESTVHSEDARSELRTLAFQIAEKARALGVKEGLEMAKASFK